MKRIHKSVLWAVILFGGGVGAGLYVLKTDVKTADERYLDKEREKRLFKEEFGLIHVKSGELMTRGTTIAFALEEGEWRIRSPVVWPGDRESIEAAINNMVGIQIDPETRVEKPDEGVLKSWSLIKPRTRMTLETERGRFALMIGPKNAVREMYPITDGERRAAGLSTPEFFWALDKPLSDFRERRVFPVKAEEIVEVRLKGKTGGFTLYRDGEKFMLSGPDGGIKEGADPDRAEIFLVALTQRLRIGRFLSDDYDPSRAAEYGLDQPAMLEVATKKGRSIAHVGKIIESGDQKGTAVMHLAGTKTVVEVPDFVHEEMAKTKADLEDRTILRFDRKQVAKIELLQGSEEIVLVKNGDDWNVTAPKQAPARIWKIDGFVRVFSRLKAERFHKDDASKSELREWLLDPPSRRLAFYDAKGTKLGEVRIGKLYAEEELFVMGEGDRVAIMKASRIQNLPKNLDDLVDSDRLQ